MCFVGGDTQWTECQLDKIGWAFLRELRALWGIFCCLYVVVVVKI